MVFGFVFVMSIITFIIYGIDKRKAINGQWRIPEKTLLLLALFGGSPGAMLAMQVFHHKTKKPGFFIGVPLIFALQCFAVFIAIVEK